MSGCPVFPADNAWNRDVSRDLVDPRSDGYVASIGAARFLHADFGSPPEYGIPWTSVPGNQPKVTVSFDYADESDPGPYPKAGEIRHALRFTVERTQRAYVHPATHFASSITDPDRPPMGLRVRLKASYDLSRFRGDSRVILAALRRYGMFVADNGSD